MPRRLTPPLRGAANNTAKVDTPEQFCPPDNLRNVRPVPGVTDRPRMGPRPGWVKAFQNQIGNGARVQALAVVGRASGVSGYESGDVTEVRGGTNRSAGTLSGQAWVLDAQHGMSADFVSGNGEYAYGVSWHPTLRRMAYFVINGPPPIYTRVRLTDCDPASAGYLSVLWTTDLYDRDPPSGVIGTTPIYANHVLVTATFTYVCASRWLFVLRTSDGVFLKRYSMSGWAEEVMGCCVRTDGKLAVCFRGSNVLSGPVTTNVADTGAGNGEGSHFRSGVMLFTITSTAPGSLSPGDEVLTVVQFGPKRTATAVSITGATWTQATKRLVKTGAFTSYTHATGRLIKITGGTGITTGSYVINAKISDDEIELVSSIGPNATDVSASELQPPWYEDHLYFRLSEHVAMTPRGRYCNAIAATPDGGVAVATCNKGWGPNSSYQPDNTVAPRSLVKISSGTTGAALLWESDIGSRLDPRVTVIGGVPTTHYNDIPHPSDAVNNTNDPHPTADAVAVDAAGDIYVGGRTSAFGYSVHKVRGSSGTMVWETNTGDWVPQHGLAFNAAQNAVAAAGKRNTTWEGSGGANALLWFIDADSGDIVDNYDLAETVNAWGAACHATSGDTAFVTDYVS